MVRYVLQFRHLLALALVFGTTQFAGACGGGSENDERNRGRGGSAGSTMDASVGDATTEGGAGTDGEDLLGDCTPVYTSCEGLCGPVTDPCTGTRLECGGCEAGLACDLDTHTCIKPKVTCADLGAECGRVRNTCGSRLDCGDCKAGFQCDPDTNRCVACVRHTCEELGYECGPAWLNCGPRNQLTDCGGCTGSVCNQDYNRCEPRTCVSKPAAQLCAEAGAQCGFISNGCGGKVSCGDCPSGQACATGGIANRCSAPEPAAECVAQARECGTITSACGGRRINCGTCPTGEVCNANGKCGPPCTPALPPAAAAVQCGTFDDGCGGKIAKPCAAGTVCNSGACCKRKTCSADYAGRCGSGLDDGCGGKLNCGCAAGQVCGAKTPGTTGTCCTRRTAAAACGTQCGPIPDGCGGTINCGCDSNQICKKPAGATLGSCCTLPTCGGTGAACNTVLSNSCGERTCSANSCGAGLACGSSDGGAGTCCELPTRPSASYCGTVSNACGERTFGCGGGFTCVSEQCCALPSCDNQCNTTLTNACGSVSCECSGSARCVSGACCAPRTCGGYYAGKCGVGLDDGCGGTIDCACGGTGNTCSVSQAGQTGTCSCPGLLTCADYPNRCGPQPNGCGGTINCTCADHKLPSYVTCGGSNQPGVCGCRPIPCGGRCGLVNNGCGGTLDCGPC